MDKFTIEEFKKYLESQESLGDIHNNLNAANIRKANNINTGLSLLTLVKQTKNTLTVKESWVACFQGIHSYYNQAIKMVDYTCYDSVAPSDITIQNMEADINNFIDDLEAYVNEIGWKGIK